MNYKQARRNMVVGQLTPCGLNNNELIEAFGQVERETFLPDGLRCIAYSDAELLVLGRQFSAPAALALVLQAAEPSEGEYVLYMGAGYGYGPAILSKLGCIINAVDSDEAHLRLCADNLESYDIKVSQYPLRKKYDKILFEGCVDIKSMESFATLLAPNGRLVGICSSGGNNAGYLFSAGVKNGFISISRILDLYNTQVGVFKPSRL